MHNISICEHKARTIWRVVVWGFVLWRKWSVGWDGMWASHSNHSIGSKQDLHFSSFLLVSFVVTNHITSPFHRVRRYMFMFNVHFWFLFTSSSPFHFSTISKSHYFIIAYLKIRTWYYPNAFLPFFSFNFGIMIIKWKPVSSAG